MSSARTLEELFFCRRRTPARVKVMESCAGALEKGTPEEDMLVQAHQWCCQVWPYRGSLCAFSQVQVQEEGGEGGEGSPSDERRVHELNPLEHA